MKSKLFLGMSVVLAVMFSFTFAACGGEETHTEKPEPEHVHEWVLVNSSKNTVTCGESGAGSFKCYGCGSTYTDENAPATGKHSFKDGACTTCGYVDMSNMTKEDAIAKYGFYHADTDKSNTYTTGDTVYFGSYPTALVEDTGVLKTLSDEAGVVPTESDAGTWTSYGYYSKGEASDYMFYKDVTLSSGKQYRGVYLLKYRPFFSEYEATTTGEHSYIGAKEDGSGNNFELNQVYWFEYEPIGWRVLGYSEGELFINTLYCLEGQPFQTVYCTNDDGEYVIPGTGTYITDWESSTIRKFLNKDFYDVAFNKAQKGLIAETELDNKTTGYAADAPYQKNQKNTTDNIFLVSYGDITNSAYFDQNKLARSYTDYSLIQGLRTSSEESTAEGDPACSYILRSAGNKSYTISCVSKKGTADYGNSPMAATDPRHNFAGNGDFGIMPAAHIEVGIAKSEGTPVAPESGTAVTWEYKTWEYNDGNSSLDYAVYIPEGYESNSYPLVTFVPDATYAGKQIQNVVTAAGPKYWATEEKQAKSPCAFLVLTLSNANGADSGTYLEDFKDEKKEVSQIVKIIDDLCKTYNLNANKLYWTGQSMGGILGWAMNTYYPEKFAASVYVGCQPGNNETDQMYKDILEAAEFKNQKFVYIASRSDPKSPLGQDAVSEILDENNVAYVTDYSLSASDISRVSEKCQNYFEENQNVNHFFFGFPQVAGGDLNKEHMNSFAFGYSVDSIFDWLLEQSNGN